MKTRVKTIVINTGPLKAVITLLIATLISLSLLAQVTDAVKLNVAGNGFGDEMVVRYEQGASDDFDANYDAYKIFSANPEIPQPYSLTPSGSPLSINTKDKLTRDDVVDVHIKIGLEADYTITPTEEGVFGTGIKLFLENLQDGSITKLVYGQAVSVHLLINDGSTPSFKLIVSTPIEAATVDASCGNTADGQATIEDLGNADFNFSIKDNAGVIVYTGTNVNESETISNLLPGDYVLTSYDYAGDEETMTFTVTGPELINPTMSATATTIFIGDGGVVSFYNFTNGADSYMWDFGDGSATSTDVEPDHTFGAIGDYTVTLTAYTGSCSETTTLSISVLAGTSAIGDITNYENEPIVYSDQLGDYVKTNFTGSGKIRISVINMQGQEVDCIVDQNTGTELYRLNLNDKAPGIYLVKVNTEDSQYTKKLYKH